MKKVTCRGPYVDKFVTDYFKRGRCYQILVIFSSNSLLASAIHRYCGITAELPLNFCFGSPPQDHDHPWIKCIHPMLIPEHGSRWSRVVRCTPWLLCAVAEVVCLWQSLHPWQHCGIFGCLRCVSSRTRVD